MQAPRPIAEISVPRGRGIFLKLHICSIGFEKSFLEKHFLLPKRCSWKIGICLVNSHTFLFGERKRRSLELFHLFGEQMYTFPGKTITYFEICRGGCFCWYKGLLAKFLVRKTCVINAEYTKVYSYMRISTITSFYLSVMAKTEIPFEKYFKFHSNCNP